MSLGAAETFGIALMATWGTAGAVALGRSVAKSPASREFATAFRKMNLASKCALVAGLAGAVAIGGTKPAGRDAPTARPPGGRFAETSRPAPPFALVEVRTNGVALASASTNAVVSESVRRRGTSEGGEWIEADAPFFLWGTNPVSRAFASPAVLSFGTMRHPALCSALPDGSPAESLIALRTPLGLAPEANWPQLAAPSRFWHEETAFGRVFTWENALLDRLADRPATIQMEARDTGDFVYRYDFSAASPTNEFFIGVQLGFSAIEALGVRGGMTNAATVYRVDGAHVPEGVSVADLFSAPRLEMRWKNVAGLGDLSGDTDGDGLTDWQETFLRGTDPRRADTDGDKIADGAEVLAEGNPLDADENGDGIPDGISAEIWAANPLWATNAPDGAALIAITLNDTIPANETASLLVDDLCIPLRAPATWTLGLVPGETYPYRLSVAGVEPVDLSIGPGGGVSPPLRTGMDAFSIALFVDGMGGVFDGSSFGGSGSMAVPTLGVQWQDPGDGSHETAAGDVCLHGGSEAVFTPLLRPSGIREQWLLSGLAERNGSLVLSVPCEGTVFSGAADLVTDRIRFGVVRALVSGHRCDATGTQPYCSVCGCYQPFDLVLETRRTLTLKHDNQTTLSILHAHSSGESHSNGVVEIRRKEEYEWLPLGPESGLDPWTARIAGTFELRGLAMVNGLTWATPIQEVEVRFPSYSEIVGDETVSNAMEAAWQKTKDDCTEVPNLRHEVGFWIQLDTVANQYVIGTLAEGPLVDPSTNGAVQLPLRPRDSPHGPEANDPGALYTVGSFHTHTPRSYIAPTNLFRRVGPSGQDHTNSMHRHVAGIVYDYIGVPDPDGNPRNRLYNGHEKEAPARLYPVPPDRRPTP